MNETYNEMLNDMAIYSERYAINRGSYANGTMADHIITCIKGGMLTPKTISVIERDIETAIKDKSIPYADQVEKWQEVLNAIAYYDPKNI